MSTERLEVDLIEAYLDSSLDEDGCRRLLDRCRHDPALVRLLAAHRGLVGALTALAESDGERTWRCLDHAIAHDTRSQRGRVADAVTRRLPRQRRWLTWIGGGLAAAALALAALSLAVTARPHPAIPTTTPTERVWLERDGRRLAPTAWGELRADDRLRTLAGARLVTKADADTCIGLEGASDLRISATAPQRRWSLANGLLHFHLDPRHPNGESLQVRTPHAACTVTGTSVRIRTDDDATLIEVIAGTIALDAPGFEDHPVGPGVLIRVDAKTTTANPVIGSEDRGEGLIRFLPAARSRYANGRYLLDEDLVIGERLWPVPVTDTAQPPIYPDHAAPHTTITHGDDTRLEFTNRDSVQRFAELVTGGCPAPCFAIGYVTEVQAHGGTPRIAAECPGGFDQDILGLPPLEIDAVPAEAPDNTAFGPERLHYLCYLHVGYDYGLRLPIYEVMVRIGDTVIGRGFCSGHPDRLVIALTRARLRVGAIALHLLEDPLPRPVSP